MGLAEISLAEMHPFPAEHGREKTNFQAQGLRAGLIYVSTCFPQLTLLHIIQTSGCKWLLPSL